MDDSVGVARPKTLTGSVVIWHRIIGVLALDLHLLAGSTREHFLMTSFGTKHESIRGGVLAHTSQLYLRIDLHLRSLPTPLVESVVGELRNILRLLLHHLNVWEASRLALNLANIRQLSWHLIVVVRNAHLIHFAFYEWLITLRCLTTGGSLRHDLDFFVLGGSRCFFLLLLFLCLDFLRVGLVHFACKELIIHFSILNFFIFQIMFTILVILCVFHQF